MKTLVTAIAALVIGSAVSLPSALAGTDADADTLGTCFADNTTGKDRKDLARWIFMGIASHPEIKALLNVTPEKREEIVKSMATLVTRLMTEDCLVQVRSAMEKNGSEAIKVAFGAVGKLAMQEVTSDPTVNASFSDFAKYLDQEKFKAAFSKK